MKTLSLALLPTLFLFAAAIAQGQSVARATQPANAISTRNNEEARAIAALKRLDQDVIIYRSLGEFEANGKLARVSFETFDRELREVSSELEAILSEMTPGKLRTQLSNAFDCYRDAAFWWRKIDQPGVVHVSALTATETTRTSSDSAFISTIPYTIAIHWRQAHTYLSAAEKIFGQPGMTSDAQRSLR